MDDKQALIKATLEWCNEMRAVKDMEPLTELPKGRRGNPSSCPCGAATGLNVTGTRYFEYKRGKTLRQGILPGPVRCFVNAFDDNMFPELVEEDDNAEDS